MQSILKQLLISLIMLCCITIYPIQHLTAQNTASLINGQVVDTDNLPLIGVSVVIKGTTKGTATSSDGSFSIQAQPSQTLLFSYIGYKPVEKQLKPGVIHQIVMEEDKTIIDEVVVIGYGVQKKATLSGAIGTTTDKTFVDKPSSNAMTALQGQVPGLNIVKTSGKPGREDWRFNIRGFSSNRELQPLLIIDGVPYPDAGELQKINSSDIENVSVLKDGSASIYGSRAAGGVILVTTKRSKQDKMQISYNGTVTLQSIGRHIEVMDRKEWFTNNEIAMNNQNAAFPYAGLREYYMGDKSGYAISRSDPAVQAAIGGAFSDVVDFGIFDTNWFDVIFGNVWSQNHNLTMSGSTAKTNYYVSIGYNDQSSPLKWGNMNDKKYNGRINLESKITRYLTSRTNITYQKEVFVEPSDADNVLGKVWGQQPGMPYQTIDGRPYAWGGHPALNWMLESGGNITRKYSRVNLSQAFDFNAFKTEEQNLTFTGQFGLNDWNYRDGKHNQSVDYYDYSGKQFVRTDPIKKNSKYSSGWDATTYQSYQLFANYQLNFHKNNDINLMLGTSYETFRKESISGARSNLTVTNLPTLIVGDPSTSTNSDYVESWGIASYFGRLNYSFKSKYLLEGNFRYDGSSRFTPSKRWGLFGGASVGWRISEESFLKDTNIFQNLKLRASYGTTGNQAGIGMYDYVSRISTSSYPFGMSAIDYLTIKPGAMVSLDRSWETLATSNIGIDFATLNGNLSGSFDLFKKTNDEMLVGLTYPGVLGANAPDTNNGKVETKGYEISLSWRDKIGENFSYNITVAFSDNKSMMTYLGKPAILKKGIQAYAEGYAPYTIFGYKTDGIIQNEAELADFKTRFPKGGIPANWGVGCAKIIDKSGDGLLNEADDVYDLGSTEPRYGYSATLGMKWKGFDFNLFMQGYGKIMGYNAQAAFPFDAWYTNNSNFWVGKTALVGDDPSNQGHKIVLNPEAKYPLTGIQGSMNYAFNDFSIHNYGYLRLKEITLGYTIPPVLCKKVKIESLRIFASGYDILEWVKWNDGMDPERDWRTAKSNNYPSMRSWSIGANITF